MRDSPVTWVRGKQPSRGKLATDFDLDPLEVGHLFAASDEGFEIQISLDLLSDDPGILGGLPLSTVFAALKALEQNLEEPA